MFIKKKTAVYLPLFSLFFVHLYPLSAKKSTPEQEKKVIYTQANLPCLEKCSPREDEASLPKLKGWFVHERTALLATNQQVKNLILEFRQLLRNGEVLMINTQEHAIVLIDALIMLVHTIRMAVIIFVTFYVVNSLIRY